MLRRVPKEGTGVGHTVRETVEPVEEGFSRAAGQHRQDGFGVQSCRPDDPELGRAAGWHLAPWGAVDRCLRHHDMRHIVASMDYVSCHSQGPRTAGDGPRRP